ncbi:MAG: sigma-70 family RNA polymerase sigma factor [Phycisphaerales bacterium]|nr:sigma-70 family RNA polymerase sigma factor [Phycisphaerales bacterium]
MNHNELTRPSLLSRLRDHSDDEAWRQFESKYRELILRYCRRRGLQAADAEDIRQATMLRLVRSLPAFAYDPSRGRFRDYLYRVVRSAMSDQISRPNQPVAAVGTDSASPEAEREAAPDTLWEQEWIDHHFRLAMSTVRAAFETRSILIFERLLAGQSVESVGAEFTVSTQAVHKVKQRIRDRLKELIDEQIREEESVE